MFLSKKVLSVVLLLSIGFLPISAVTPQKSKTKKKKKTTTTVVAKEVKLNKSGDDINLTGDNGNTIALPKIDQTIVDQPDYPSIADNWMADADFSKKTGVFEKQLIERKEMQELSVRLGVAITDPAYLEFYREVADWLGTRYKRGGMSRKGVDCSGFTNIIYNTVFDQKLDRVSTTIAHNLKEPVSKDDLLPGDMVFFSTFKKKYINHVGVYIGDGLFVHASIKRGVIVSSLAEGYYSTSWRKGGRNKPVNEIVLK